MKKRRGKLVVKKGKVRGGKQVMRKDKMKNTNMIVSIKKAMMKS